MSYMIEVKNLSRFYGNKPGVEDISFSIEAGDIVGLLGANGAGKSTLMKMLTGYHMPTAGEIRIDGIDLLLNPKEALQKIGFMPEVPPLYPEMTVFEGLSFVAGIRGCDKNRIREEVHTVSEMAGITDVSDRLIRNLSKGYRQRVGMAQALIGSPPILIMDEPTAGLDPGQMAEFRSLVGELGGKHTILISSHILSEIHQICHSLMILNQGHLVAYDTIENLEGSGEARNWFDVKLRGDKQKALDMIRKLPGVMNVQDISTISVEDDCCYFSIQAEADTVRDALFYACAQADMPILEMVPQRAGLEQVFLRLSSSS